MFLLSLRPAVVALALAPAALWLGPPPAAAATFDLPPIDRIVNYQPKLPLQVFTADGVEIAQFGAERREYVPLAQTPKLLQDAVLAVEDELNAAAETEPAVVTGRFMPTEAPVVPEGDQGPFVESTLSVASLVNLWPNFSGPVYEGYLVADVAPAGLDVIESIPPMNEGSVNWLNIFYAVEWIVFAGFAFFIWWRLVKDAYERELEEKAQLEAK